jgi:hypothetical protein
MLTFTAVGVPLVFHVCARSTRGVASAPVSDPPVDTSADVFAAGVIVCVASHVRAADSIFVMIYSGVIERFTGVPVGSRTTGSRSESSAVVPSVKAEIFVSAIASLH